VSAATSESCAKNFQARLRGKAKNGGLNPNEIDTTTWLGFVLRAWRVTPLGKFCWTVFSPGRREIEFGMFGND
jgi:hypothetical protein